MPRWRKRSQKSVLEVFEVNVLSFQGACVKNVTLNRPICRATHVINLSVKNDSLRKIALLLNCCIVEWANGADLVVGPGSEGRLCAVRVQICQTFR